MLVALVEVHMDSKETWSCPSFICWLVGKLLDDYWATLIPKHQFPTMAVQVRGRLEPLTPLALLLFP